MAVPWSREQARLTACQKNLAQIGLALALYDQTQLRLPTIGHPAAIDGSGRAEDPGPLKILSLTAGFSERFVGDHVADHVSPANFAVPPGPLPSQGCSAAWLAEADARWHGDAGSSWVEAGYQSTLYNHSIAPDAPVSCVGGDGQAAFLGASSGPVHGVNLLMLDGSVKLVVPSIDPVVWREFADLRDPDSGSRNP